MIANLFFIKFSSKIFSKKLGNSCLHFSCMNGYYESTIILLNYGANPSIVNKVLKILLILK